ncbi:trypsin-like peptidase domain-containing protein [Kribbella sp. NPDC051770]|uniref:S1C family serine protease n=1 Tax=Kribbella sp. NPDC051770 TaxID=3155413 RepID=UPI003432BF79
MDQQGQNDQRQPGYVSYGYPQPGPWQQGQYPPPYGPWQQPQPPKRRRRLPAMVGALGLAAALVAGSVAWGIDQHVANSSQLAQVLSPADVAAKVSPGLVNINTVLGFEGARAAGTGIVLTPDGEVLTNHHVVQGATQISVVDVGNGKTYQASVVGYDDSHDIAVLKLKDASGLQTAKIGDSSTVKIGDDVVGIGNAGGKGGQPSYAPGDVTALNQAITATDESGQNPENLTGLIATDANIQAGDSGGPLANSAGEVIGVDVAGSGGNGNQGGAGQTAFDPSAPGFGDGGFGQGNGFGQGDGGFGDGQSQGNGGFGNGQSQGDGGQSQGDGGGSGQTQGFAIPINQAMAIADQIEAGQSSADVHIGDSPILGITVLTNGDQGAVVNDVVANGKAAAAGLSAGDVITALGGKTIDSPEALSTALNEHHPGDKVAVTWTDQSGQRHTADIELTTGPVR